MKIFALKEIPVEHRNDYLVDELEDYEIERLKELGIDAVVYWYVTAPYEGSGDMLILKDGLWYLHSMGHCSCYGPTEKVNKSLSMETGHATLDELFETLSDGYKSSFGDLIELAKENGLS
jgi:hypothetical protein